MLTSQPLLINKIFTPIPIQDKSLIYAYHAFKVVMLRFKNDSRVLFEEIFEGIRASLMKRFTKDVLMSQSPKDQNTP
jgi:hypothetical protein